MYSSSGDNYSIIPVLHLCIKTKLIKLHKMIETIFLGLAGIVFIVLFACIASYNKEIKNLLREKLNTRKTKRAREWQFDEEDELFAYVDYERKSIYEESEYEESKPVYASPTQPSVI